MVKLKSFFSLKREEKRLLACFIPLEADSHLDLDQKLRQLKVANLNGKINAIIEKLLLWLQIHSLIKLLAKEYPALQAYMKQIECSLLVKQDYTKALEMAATPASYFLFSLLRNHLISWVNDEIRDLPFNHLTDFKQVVTFWNERRGKQRALFQYVKGELDQLIGNLRGQDKIKFASKYTKDMTGISIGPALTSYPSEDDILGLPPSKPEAEKPSAKASEKGKAKEAQPKKQKVKIERPLKKGTEGPRKETVATPPEEKESTTEDEEISFVAPAPSPVLERTVGEPFPYLFDERVERWRRHPFGQPLPADAFPEPEYQEMSLSAQQRMHVFHHPTDVIDRFLYLAIEGTWPNQKKGKDNLRFVIPAEFTFQGQKDRGFVSWAIDRETGICYHRCLTKRMHQDILSDTIFQTFQENDFPELAQAALSFKSPQQVPLLISDAKVIVDPIFGNVTIDQPEKDLTIKLFNTNR